MILGEALHKDSNRQTYRYLALEKYAVGIEQSWVDPAHPVLMASIEKALCDYVVLNQIPAWESFSEARSFLESDLRMDPEHWQKFDLGSLRELSRIYRSKNIDWLLEVLEKASQRRFGR